MRHFIPPEHMYFVQTVGVKSRQTHKIHSIFDRNTFNTVFGMNLVAWCDSGLERERERARACLRAQTRLHA